MEHESDSGIGLLGERAEAVGAELHTVTPITGIPTSAQGYDVVVILGSAESVTSLGTTPWFLDEQALLKDADTRNVPILGVCFGAQSLAVALGGQVVKASEQEVGWKMIDSVDPAVLSEGPWFQWHEDAIEPPPGSTVLATSDVCVEAYRNGVHLGVQFHPEITAQQALDWSASDPTGLAASGCTLTELVALTNDLEADARRRAADLWDAFVAASCHR